MTRFKTLVVAALASVAMLAVVAAPSQAAQSRSFISIVQRGSTSCKEARDSVRRAFGYSVKSQLCMTRVGGGKILWAGNGRYVYTIVKAYFNSSGRWFTTVRRS